MEVLVTRAQKSKNQRQLHFLVQAAHVVRQHLPSASIPRFFTASVSTSITVALECREIQSQVSPYKMAVSGRMLSVLFVLLVVFLNVDRTSALARNSIIPASAPAPEPTSGAGAIVPGLLVPVLIALASFLVGRQ
ncbi:hypothetical protein R1sor_013496 [Riccia sorocarpa]|uniref:Uncharacterized protein n=1 Tax=Riccia sorocarpa TaxID=122646 RepID=A0ABD3H9C3_9MARC